MLIVDFILWIYNLLLLEVHIGGYQLHVWSFVTYAVFCGVAFYKISRYVNIIYALMLAYLLGSFGNDLYESIWQYMTYETSINSYFMQYIVVVIGLFLALVVCNYMFKFIHLTKLSIVLYLIELSTFYIFTFTGYYPMVRAWLASGMITANPHDWLWMINKGLGVWFLYPMILNKKQHEERKKNVQPKTQ